MVLGVAFESGTDEKHFCKPTDVAVSERTGDFFVADGYCNKRILKFSSDGQLKQIISKYNISVWVYNINLSYKKGLGYVPWYCE